MPVQDIRAGVIAVLRSIAPEIDETELLADRLLRGQVDLDSMDWRNVIIGLHQRFDVDIPEADYKQLDTLDHISDYLAGKIGL